MKNINIIVALFTLFALPITVQAGQDLSSNEIKALFTDKTFNGENTKSGWTFDNYASADGECIIHYTSGKKSGQTMNNRWSIKGDMHCCEKPNKKVCGTISNEGDGIYYKTNKRGKHIQTFSNFVDGNQL